MLFITYLILITSIIKPLLILSRKLDTDASSSEPALCNGEILTIDIKTDKFSSETTWNITGSYGNTVLRGGPYPSRHTHYVTEKCLYGGNYTFLLFDAQGDGICCFYGEGGYKLSIAGEIIKEGGDFSYVESTNFSIAGTPPSYSPVSSKLTTHAPTSKATPEPSNKPTAGPTNTPTSKPTPEPSNAPTNKPTPEPSNAPTNKPTPEPSNAPTSKPTPEPSNAPTNKPTARPTKLNIMRSGFSYGVVTSKATSMKDTVGSGCQNNVQFSSKFMTDSGEECNTCVLCDGSHLSDIFKPKSKGVCVDCSAVEDTCNNFSVTTKFDSEWIMKFVSLAPSSMSSESDPKVVIIEGSTDAGTWVELHNIEDMLFKTRTESTELLLSNHDTEYKHYRITFKPKDNMSKYYLGHYGLIPSYTKTCTSNIYLAITGEYIRPYEALS